MRIWTIISDTEPESCGFCDEQSCLTNLQVLGADKHIDRGLTAGFPEGFWQGPSPNALKEIQTLQGGRQLHG